MGYFTVIAPTHLFRFSTPDLNKFHAMRPLVGYHNFKAVRLYYHLQFPAGYPTIVSQAQSLRCEPLSEDEVVQDSP